jgi:putative transposase
MTVPERRGAVDKIHQKLSIKKQCNLLGIHRSGFYYVKKETDPLNNQLMLDIDIEYMKRPFRGVASMLQYLRLDCGYHVNKKRIARLYKLMDLHSIAPGPHTSKGCKEHKKYPYLLRDLEITQTNQVWATDITYIPVKNGYMYLIAIIDLYSRFVLGWSLSNTMESEWCLELLQKTVATHGNPEIFNTDQGSQFTSEIFTGFLTENGIKISMDGRGRATDNIFIERLWRSVKYEDVYPNAYESGIELRKGLKEYFIFYNQIRRHSSIENKRPYDLYYAAA